MKDPEDVYSSGNGSWESFDKPKKKESGYYGEIDLGNLEGQHSHWKTT